MSEKIGNGHNVNLEILLEDLRTVLKDSQEVLRASYGTIKQRARYGVEKTNTFVREKPYHSLGAAFGVGVLAGVLVASLVKGALETKHEED